jgi:hypothetical protein
MLKKATFSPAQPWRAKTRPAQTRPQRVKDRGGTYQALLEPLASITCERIGTSPPVGFDRYVEGLNDARTPLAGFFSIRFVN